jgi:ketosteroid isomerase-like protein
MSQLRNYQRLVATVALMLVGLLAMGPALADDAKHEFDALNAHWVAAFKANDFAAIEALMAPDSLLLAPGAPPIQGAKAVAAMWESWGALPNVAIDFGATLVEVAASGELAYDYGTYTFAFDSEEGPFKENGKYIVVWKKIDGAWKIAADIFNNNGAP